MRTGRSDTAAQLLRKTVPVSFHGCACVIRLNVRALPVHAKTLADRSKRFPQRPRLVTVPVKIFSRGSQE
jgi:hypothetical protein